MNKENIVDKIKHFWDDTEAISPIVATIMVLVVAVAAGAGLYFWFDEFQTGAQEEVGEASTGSMRSMVIGSADIQVRPFDEKPSLDGIDATGDTAIDNLKGNGQIARARNYSANKLGLNGIYGVAWHDERIVVEIPITITSSAELEGVTLITEKPVVNKGTLKSYMWLHLDKDNDYQLLKKDDTVFKGFINDSEVKVYEDGANGYTYYFGGKKHLGLDIVNGIRDNATGTLADNLTTTNVDESNLVPRTISSKDGALRVMQLFTREGFEYWAFAKNDTGSDLGWITCDHIQSGDTYFTGTDKIDDMFNSGTYEVADTLVPNEAVTVYKYFMINGLLLDNYGTTNEDGSAEIELPFRIITKEGLTESGSITLTIMD